MKKVFAFALVLSLLGVMAVSQDALARRGGTCPDDNPKRRAGCTDDNKAVEQIEIAKRGADDNNPTDDKGGKGKGEKAGLADQIAKRGAETEKGEKGEKGEGVEKVG